MHPQLAGLLLLTLLPAALGKEEAGLLHPRGPGASTSSVLPGSRMRYYDCTVRGPCEESPAICQGHGCVFLEHKPPPGLEHSKLPGNPSVTLSHHRPPCAAAHLCNPVETESVGGLTYTAHKNCCPRDPCSGAGSTPGPTCVLAAVAATLAWLAPGLWSG